MRRCSIHTGTLARLFDVERQAGEGSGHSISEAMAAAETCPMGALEHTAVSALVWSHHSLAAAAVADHCVKRRGFMGMPITLLDRHDDTCRSAGPGLDTAEAGQRGSVR